MFKKLSHDARTVVLAVIAASVVAGPSAAAAAYVANADKVDNKHAVGSGATFTARKGKLVATNATTGLLPNNLIAQAVDAAKLGGIAPEGYVRNLPDSVTGEHVQNYSLQRSDLSPEAAGPRAFGLVHHTGSLETSKPYQGMTAANVTSPADTQGVYCIRGLGFTPTTVSASSALWYSGPVTVHSTLTQGSGCEEVEGTQITVHTFAIQNASPYDGSFNLQIWGN